MTKAAGLMLVSGSGDILFVQRGLSGDFPGHWTFPGGGVEDGETAEEAAERETREEVGPAPYDLPRLWTRRVRDDGFGEVDFTTFIAKVGDAFTPKLNDEIANYAWVKADAPPQPLHPGVPIALARFGMDELAVAHAIAGGELTSPQQYGSFWLWSLRITGTGAAYRDARNEYCWRPGELYLTETFLARCNGLPVIFVHPEKKSKLDSEEFHNRVVGTVFVPFMRGDEVWAVCRIYDDATIAILRSERFSTSPGVVFGPDSGNRTLKLKDGSHLLIEGKAAVLDHIALVPAGVWDKGGEPSGVETSSGSISTLAEDFLGMTEEEKAAAEKAGSDANAKLDAVLGRLDAMNSRMDAIEEFDKKREEERNDRARLDAARKDRFGHRKDGETFRDYRKRHDADEAAMCDALRKDGSEEEKAREDAKRARKDAEEEERRSDESFDEWTKEEKEEPDHKKERQDAETGEEKRALEAANKAREEKEREDRARKDSAMASENADLKQKLADLTRTVSALTTVTTAEDRNAIATAQGRADGIAGLFGSRAVPPMMGEAPRDYRRRLAANFRQHSPKFKEARFDSMDDATFSAVEEIVYNDAAAAAHSPERASAGVLIPIREPDEAGRTITRWTGDNLAWMQYFMTPGRVGKFVEPRSRRG